MGRFVTSLDFAQLESDQLNTQIRRLCFYPNPFNSIPNPLTLYPFGVGMTGRDQEFSSVVAIGRVMSQIILDLFNRNPTHLTGQTGQYFHYPNPLHPNPNL